MGIGVRRWVGALWLVAALVLASHTAAQGQTGCAGDCNGDHEVMINELVVGVNIALERASIAACASFDANDSGTVEINELVRAVRNVLDGCPDVPPTPTSTRVTPVVTPNPTDTTAPEPSATATIAGPTETPDNTETPTRTQSDTVPTTTDTPAATATTTGTSMAATATATGTGTSMAATATATGTATSMAATATATLSSTNTATGTPTVTPSPTPTLDLEKFATASGILFNAIGPIPNLLGALVTGIRIGSAGQASGILVGDMCPDGGTVVTTAGRDGITWAFTNCTLGDGTDSVSINGMLRLDIQNLDALSGTISTAELSIAFVGQSMPPALASGLPIVPTLNMVMNFTAAMRLDLDDAPGDPCNFDLDPPEFADDIIAGIALGDISGGVSVFPEDGGIFSTEFRDTRANITVDDYSPQCMPIDYAIELNGLADLLLAPPGGGDGLAAGIPSIPFRAEFDDYRIDATVGQDTVTPLELTMELSGVLESPCFGRGNITTLELVSLPFGDICPTDGTLGINDIGQLLYMNGMVGIDTDNDGIADAMYDSCFASPLDFCPS